MSGGTRSGQHGFLKLSENRLACQAVRRMFPNVRRKQLEVVTIYGPAGCGKSELVRELLRQWHDGRPDAKVRCVTASEFAAQLAEAVDSGGVPQFQDRYRKDVDLVVIEDIQALADRPAAQRELTVTIDQAARNGGHVLLTANRSPGELAGLTPRLVNRCHGGISIGINLPGLESRTKLVRHFAQHEQLPLTAKHCEKIAQAVEGGGRELLGFLRTLTTQLTLSSRSESIAKVIDQILARQEAGTAPDISQITKAASRHFEIPVKEIQGTKRAKPIALARHVSMYLTRELTKLQFKEIGNYFGGRSHSTVLHSCQQIQNLKKDDAKLIWHLEQICDQLESRGFRCLSSLADS
ncbi:MAG: DnaA/Hda family protein [Planctomycetaceae bacterium]